MSKEVVIVSAARTPIGSFNGSLAGMSAVEIGVVAAKEAIRRAGIRPDQIDEVVAGNVLGAGLGQNVIRQVAVHAGIPVEKPAFTINIVCGSGLRSVSLATQIIKAGDADVILCGGTESMTNAPYLLPNARNGHRMGDGQIVDSMIKDGLTEAFSNVHMGITAENIAERWHISREDQDRFAVTSQQRCEAAQKAGRFKDEIVPVEIPQKRGEPKIFDTDEFPRPGTTLEALAKLRPAFKKDGTVTAAASSSINDGAAAVVLMTESRAKELGCKPLARIVSYATHSQEPGWFTTAPVQASEKALKKAGWQVGDVDLWEVNEAFAVVPMALMHELKVPHDKVNVNGGACALGHPIGASGARIIVTLLYALKKRGLKKGLATLCIGGGEGTAMALELL